MGTTFVRTVPSGLFHMGHLVGTCVQGTTWTVYEPPRSSECHQTQTRKSEVQGTGGIPAAGIWIFFTYVEVNHISAILEHLSQASESSSVHHVIFGHSTVVND